MLIFISKCARKMATNKTIDKSQFEPWRSRLVQAIEARPDIEITKVSMKLGKNRDYLGRLIKGVAQPDPSLLIKICEEYEVSPAYIISGESNSDPKDQLARRVLQADKDTARRMMQMMDLMDADRGTK